MISIDMEKGSVTVDGPDGSGTYDIGSAEGFEVISRAWIRSGWIAKYSYTFTWLGRPVIQLPEDLMRVQELIYCINPDVIVETGIAHGGSLIFYATLCKTMERGRVVGVDVEIRPHNRQMIEAHPLFPWITLIEGDSIAAETVNRVRDHINPSDTVLVFLDSNHSKAHVRAELEAYAPLVSVGSYVVTFDSVMAFLAGAPRTQADWTWNNPRDAAREFAADHPHYRIETPAFLFNEGVVRTPITYCPEAFLKRIA